MKFRIKTLVRRDYSWRVRSPLTEYNIRSLTPLYNFYKQKRTAFKNYSINKKFTDNKLANLLRIYDLVFF